MTHLTYVLVAGGLSAVVLVAAVAGERRSVAK